MFSITNSKGHALVLLHLAHIVVLLVFPALLMGIGVYAIIDKWTSGEGFRLENVFDVIFNLAFLVVIVGGIMFIVSHHLQ